jgi:hypothetical protein
MRSTLGDNPNFKYIEPTSPVLKKVGWSPNDYLMFRTWLYEDESVYSKDKLETILSALPQKWHQKNLNDAIYWTKRLRWYLLSSFTFIFLCAFLMPFGHRILIALSLTTSGVILTYLIYAHYLPTHGTVSIVTFLGFASIFLATKDIETNKTRSFIGLTVLLCLFLAISATCLWQYHKRSNWNKSHQDSLVGFVRVIAKPNVLYAVWPLAFPYQYISPFSNLKELDSFHIYPFSYISQSPISKEIRTKFGVNNLYTALYEKDNVLLMFSPDNLPLLKNFIEEHYGASVYFEQVLKYAIAGDKMGVYKVLRNSE